MKHSLIESEVPKRTFMNKSGQPHRPPSPGPVSHGRSNAEQEVNEKGREPASAPAKKRTATQSDASPTLYSATLCLPWPRKNRNPPTRPPKDQPATEPRSIRDFFVNSRPHPPAHGRILPRATGRLRPRAVLAYKEAFVLGATGPPTSVFDRERLHPPRATFPPPCSGPRFLVRRPASSPPRRPSSGWHWSPDQCLRSRATHPPRKPFSRLQSKIRNRKSKISARTLCPPTSLFNRGRPILRVPQCPPSCPSPPPHQNHRPTCRRQPPLPHLARPHLPVPPG